MPTVQTRPHHIVQQFDELKAVLGTYGPAELQAVREMAMERFRAVGMPTLRDEEFRYTSLRILDESPFKPAYGATITRHEAESAALGNVDAATVSFINGQFAPELGILHALSAALSSRRGLRGLCLCTRGGSGNNFRGADGLPSP